MDDLISHYTLCSYSSNLYVLWEMRLETDLRKMPTHGPTAVATQIQSDMIQRFIFTTRAVSLPQFSFLFCFYSVYQKLIGEYTKSVIFSWEKIRIAFTRIRSITSPVSSSDSLRSMVSSSKETCSLL